MNTRVFLRSCIKSFFRYSRLAQGWRAFSYLMEEIEQDRIRRYPGFHERIFFNGRNIFISHPEKVMMGEGSGLHDNSYLETRGGLAIGRYVHIGRGINIFTTNHNFLSTELIPYDEKVILGPVVINDFVWIGSNVSITPGVTIEEGAIVGMGAVVTKNVPKCAIVGGNPARIIGYRDEAIFERLKAEGKYF